MFVCLFRPRKKTCKEKHKTLILQNLKKNIVRLGSGADWTPEP
jgi:hypothetical protein